MAAVDVGETQLATNARTAAQVLADSRDLIEPAMRAAVDTLPTSMRMVAGYHLGWWETNGEPSKQNGGKAFRPAMVLSAASAVGGRPENAIPAAVAVELIHNFSLLHDDVLDRDTTRRHRPTAWTQYGKPAAIMTGNALQSLAFDVLADGPQSAVRDSARLLDRAAVELLDGQIADLGFEERSDVELSECVRMAEGKSAALVAGACALGGLFGGAAPEQVGRLHEFGKRLGLAFQMVDDLLGVWGDPASTGKPVYSDLRNRKKSLPVVAALTSGTSAGRELATLYEHDGELSDADLVRAAELIELAGGRDWTRSRADDLLDAALRELDSIHPVRPAADELTNLARLVSCRDR